MLAIELAATGAPIPPLTELLGLLLGFEVDGVVDGLLLRVEVIDRVGVLELDAAWPEDEAREPVLLLLDPKLILLLMEPLTVVEVEFE